MNLLRWLIRSYSNPGEVVLDFCMGSGSTGEACALEGRRFIGMERCEVFFTQARDRLNGLALKRGYPQGSGAR